MYSKHSTCFKLKEVDQCEVDSCIYVNCAAAPAVVTDSAVVVH